MFGYKVMSFPFMRDNGGKWITYDSWMIIQFEVGGPYTEKDNKGGKVHAFMCLLEGSNAPYTYLQ